MPTDENLTELRKQVLGPLHEIMDALGGKPPTNDVDLLAFAAGGVYALVQGMDRLTQYVEDLEIRLSTK